VIRRIVPLAFDSFGVRSMATFVETYDSRILIDPGVALAPLRYGLRPHFLEWKRLDETWEKINRFAGEADVLVVTHYHYDHHDPYYPELYRGKTVFVKHHAENINASQKERAAFYLRGIKGLPKKLRFADGKSFRLGKTSISFSKAVYHGTNSGLGYVTEISIKGGAEKFLHTSDVEGPSLEEQIGFILKEKPDVLFVDGPMTYLLGYRYSHRSLEISCNNLARAVKETSVHTVVLDHHFLRDLNYKEKIGAVYDAAEERAVNVVTAAEFLGVRVEMLEALRKELYAKYGERDVRAKSV